MSPLAARRSAWILEAVAAACWRASARFMAMFMMRPDASRKMVSAFWPE